MIRQRVWLERVRKCRHSHPTLHVARFDMTMYTTSAQLSHCFTTEWGNTCSTDVTAVKAFALLWETVLQ